MPGNRPGAGNGPPVREGGGRAAGSLRLAAVSARLDQLVRAGCGGGGLFHLSPESRGRLRRPGRGRPLARRLVSFARAATAISSASISSVMPRALAPAVWLWMR